MDMSELSADVLEVIGQSLSSLPDLLTSRLVCRHWSICLASLLQHITLFSHQLKKQSVKLNRAHFVRLKEITIWYIEKRALAKESNNSYAELESILGTWASSTTQPEPEIHLVCAESIAKPSWDELFTALSTSCANLSTLCIYLPDEDPKVVPLADDFEKLATLLNLRKLCVNSLSDGFMALDQALLGLSSLTQLTELRMGCLIQYNQQHTFMQGVSALSSLKALEILAHSVRPSLWGNMPLYNSLSGLTRLYLHGVRLREGEGQSVLKLSDLTDLASLRLWRGFGGDRWYQINMLTNLTELCMYGCRDLYGTPPPFDLPSLQRLSAQEVSVHDFNSHFFALTHVTSLRVMFDVRSILHPDPAGEYSAAWARTLTSFTALRELHVMADIESVMLDEELQLLVSNMPLLHAFNYAGYMHLTGPGLGALRQLSSLVHLGLIATSSARSPAGVLHPLEVAQLPTTLSSMTLSNMQLLPEDPSMDVQVVSTACEPLADDGSTMDEMVACTERHTFLPELKCLYLSYSLRYGSDIAVAASGWADQMACLQRMTALKELHLTSWALHTEAISQLITAVSGITSLELMELPVQQGSLVVNDNCDSSLTALSRLSRLECLCLKPTGLTSSSWVNLLSSLAMLTRLTSLELVAGSTGEELLVTPLITLSRLTGLVRLEVGAMWCASEWGPEGRAPLDALVTAMPDCRVRVFSNHGTTLSRGP